MKPLELRQTHLIVILMIFLVNLAVAEESYWNPEDSGPMHLPSIGLIESNQFTPTIFGPSEFKRNHWIVFQKIYWINIWSYNIIADIPFVEGDDPESFPFKFGTFLIDMESLCVSNCLGIGLTDRLDVSVEIPVYYLGGGFMDGFIEGFHETFGINQHRRDIYPRDKISIFFVDENGESDWIYESDLEGFNLGNIVLYGGYKVRLREPRMTVRLGVKIPTNTGIQLTSQDGIDVTSYLTMSWKWANTNWYQGFGAIYYGDTGIPIINFNRWKLTSATTIEIPFNDRIAGLIHVVSESPAAEYSKFDKSIFEISMGLRHKWKNTVIDYGFIENIFYYDHSPDFGFYCGIKNCF